MCDRDTSTWPPGTKAMWATLESCMLPWEGSSPRTPTVNWEFYYIQMEKYARQSLSEGTKNADDISVTFESEIIRALNLHYNRNNHLEIPEHFRYVVEQTLREFFKAIQEQKDQEQSWKKAIYKIIARLDEQVPEYFKSPTFLEQLE
ncbi:Homeobox protein prospero [Portunus trituberculatus]|uniref:Homeobox protein prospero n=1 Tax=Portunus trituberculatus TaxID=210409 RepID=A0A5B7DTW6_PORTR|nr:Homeobox protein prospero [Portunus trituberculatus]